MLFLVLKINTACNNRNIGEEVQWEKVSYHLESKPFSHDLVIFHLQKQDRC
jgi:hypothetical protein